MGGGGGLCSAAALLVALYAACALFCFQHGQLRGILTTTLAVTVLATTVYTMSYDARKQRPMWSRQYVLSHMMHFNVMPCCVGHERGIVATNMSPCAITPYADALAAVCFLRITVSAATCVPNGPSAGA